MKNILLLIAGLFIIASVKAQNAIKRVIIEPYYISDANDASDTTGSFLETGSITYRIYIQMKPGSQLLKIYGDENHPLKIASTAGFFNNKDYGKTFGKDFSKNNYSNNTVALDSWITLGQTTRKSSITYIGVPKSLDADGSFIGGVSNDGGSSEISGGLLINNDPLAGIPLTIADGMDTINKVPTGWSDYGFVDPVSGVDSTIFGSAKAGHEFLSTNAFLFNSGVMGTDPDSNLVLLAQLTTKGQISFELNVQIEEINGLITKYVASGIAAADEIVSPFLKYPEECGCKDPDYLEYKSKYLCSDKSACRTLVVLGCMDPQACNYNSDANYNIQSMCCYPGMCADRDISLVCPDLGNNVPELKIYPNPASDRLEINISNLKGEKVTISVFNMFGNKFSENIINNNSDIITQDVNVSALKNGLYYVQVQNAEGLKFTRFFIKN